MSLPTRIGRLHPPVLCFVVSRATVKDGDIAKAVEEAVAGGVTMVQLREEAPSSELLELARSLKAVTRGKALLIINDRIDIGLAAELDGAQLPLDGLQTRAARGLIGRYGVLGRNAYDAETAHLAGQEGADFVLAGSIYKSKTKTDAKPVGVDVIRDITKDSSIPVLAIGGVTAAKVREVIDAGAAGIAVVSAIAGAADRRAAAEELSKALTEAWTARTEEAVGA